MNRFEIATVDNDDVFLFIMARYFREYSKLNIDLEPKFVNKANLLIEALEFGYRPDLILLDLNMPVMNGFDFLDAYYRKGLNLLSPETKVFIITSSLSERDKKLSLKYGVVKAFIEKIAGKELLENIMKTYLSLSTDQCFNTPVYLYA